MNATARKAQITIRTIHKKSPLPRGRGIFFAPNDVSLHSGDEVVFLHIQKNSARAVEREPSSGRNFSRMGRVRAARQKSTFNLVHISGAWYNREVLDGMALVVDCLVGSPSGRSFGGSFIEGGG